MFNLIGLQAVFIITLYAIGLKVFSLVSVYKDASSKNQNKVLWLILTWFFDYLAVILYLIVSNSKNSKKSDLEIIDLTNDSQVVPKKKTSIYHVFLILYVLVSIFGSIPLIIIGAFLAGFPAFISIPLLTFGIFALFTLINAVVVFFDAKNNDRPPIFCALSILFFNILAAAIYLIMYYVKLKNTKNFSENNEVSEASNEPKKEIIITKNTSKKTAISLIVYILIGILFYGVSLYVITEDDYYYYLLNNNYQISANNANKVYVGNDVTQGIPHKNGIPQDIPHKNSVPHENQGIPMDIPHIDDNMDNPQDIPYTSTNIPSNYENLMKTAIIKDRQYKINNISVDSGVIFTVRLNYNPRIDNYLNLDLDIKDNYLINSPLNLNIFQINNNQVLEKTIQVKMEDESYNLAQFGFNQGEIYVTLSASSPIHNFDAKVKLDN